MKRGPVPDRRWGAWAKRRERTPLRWRGGVPFQTKPNQTKRIQSQESPLFGIHEDLWHWLTRTRRAGRSASADGPCTMERSHSQRQPSRFLV